MTSRHLASRGTARPHTNLHLLQEWELWTERGKMQSYAHLCHPDCPLTRFPCDSLRVWLQAEPTGPAPASSGSGQGSAEVCVLGGATREPAVGPLTSFQSLPFINIYSSSPTKNNILEPREQKKINENHRELGLIIMCARAEWNPEQGRGGASTAPGGGQRSLWWSRVSAPCLAGRGLGCREPSGCRGRNVRGCRAERSAPPSRLGCRAAASNGAGGSLTSVRERKEAIFSTVARV